MNIKKKYIAFLAIVAIAFFGIMAYNVQLTDGKERFDFSLLSIGKIAIAQDENSDDDGEEPHADTCYRGWKLVDGRYVPINPGMKIYCLSGSLWCTESACS